MSDGVIVWTGSEFTEWDRYRLRDLGMPDYAREATPEEAALYRQGQARISELVHALQRMVDSYEYEASMDNPALLEARRVLGIEPDQSE